MPKVSKQIRVTDGGTLELGAFCLTPTGLVVTGRPSFDEWQDCGKRLQIMEGAVQFWIGDWLNFGEHAYGEKYAQAVNETQAETWQHYAWVSSHVETCTRVQDLSWSHHREVAKLNETPDVQRELLEQAIGLSVTEFKALIRSRAHSDKVAAIASGKLTAAEYDVICADPPWQYDNSGFPQSAAAHYPTMDVQAICDLIDTDPTFPKFADPSVLFLWATSPLMPAAVTVMAAWGFDIAAKYNIPIRQGDRIVNTNGARIDTAAASLPFGK